MARRGVTQTALARQLGISQAAVNARLKGHTPFNINDLVRIAEVLDVPLDRLLDGVAAA